MEILVLPPLRFGLVKLATLNLSLFRSQPKLYEDPCSFFLFISLLLCFWLVYFDFWDP